MTMQAPVTTDTPSTPAGITARLSEIAPYPAPDLIDLPAALGSYLLTGALCRWKSQLLDGTDGSENGQSPSGIMADVAALLLLLQILDVSPTLAHETAAQIVDVWDQPDDIGEWLADKARALGIDPGEIMDLQQAWRAAAHHAAAPEVRERP